MDEGLNYNSYVSQEEKCGCDYISQKGRKRHLGDYVMKKCGDVCDYVTRCRRRFCGCLRKPAARRARHPHSCDVDVKKTV